MKATENVLLNKTLGSKIRLIHLDASRFYDLSHDVIIPDFGILTRYEDGTVGVSFIIQGEPDCEGKRYGIWVQEQTQETTVKAWAKMHENPKTTFAMYK